MACFACYSEYLVNFEKARHIEQTLTRTNKRFREFVLVSVLCGSRARRCAEQALPHLTDRQGQVKRHGQHWLERASH